MALPFPTSNGDTANAHKNSSNAESFAREIQHNVDEALLHPTNRGALEALQKDSQLLCGSALQNQVQADLTRIETANKHLPQVTIWDSGEITARENLPGTTTISNPDYDPEEPTSFSKTITSQNGRELYAFPEPPLNGAEVQIYDTTDLRQWTYSSPDTTLNDAVKTLSGAV